MDEYQLKERETHWVEDSDICILFFSKIIHSDLDFSCEEFKFFH